MHSHLSRWLTCYPAAVAYCHLSRIFRSFKNRKNIGLLAIIVSADAEMALHYKRAAGLVLAGKPMLRGWDVEDTVFVERAGASASNFDHLLSHYGEHQVTAWVFDRLEDVPPEFITAADIFEVVGDPDLEICRAAIYHLCGTMPSPDDANFVMSHTPRQIAAAFRPGRSLERSLKSLRQIPATPSTAPAPQPMIPRPTQDFEKLIGYGAAHDWGRQLIKDVADFRAGRLSWGEVDPGLLISGPTGCGKTRFAEILAQAADMSLVIGSAGRWQAAGHLGDFLREMRKAFNDAQEKAPAILLIDEIDSFGNRLQCDRDHQSYNRQVINAALECLDGAVRREGVVVMGTTNYPEHLDPAFLRPGRLDRHIRIALPNYAARLAIINQYTGIELSTFEADEFCLLTEGWSGAQLEQLAREAKRSARKENRLLKVADLFASLPELIPVPCEHFEAAAIHEAGHALVGLSFGRVIEKIEVADRVYCGSSVMHLGGVQFLESDLRRRTAAYYCDEVAISLAGVAAELEVLGNYSDGAGRHPSSDLAHATNLATLMEGACGMGSTWISESCNDDADARYLRLQSPSLWKRVDAILSEQMDRARRLIRSNRHVLDLIVERSLENRKISGEELNLFLSEQGMQIFPPDDAGSRASQERVKLA